MPIPSSLYIKSGYHVRTEPCYFSDKPRGLGRKIVWQPEVYSWARTLARDLGCRRVLDLGCGNGEKLAAFHPEFEVVGVDFGNNLDHCRKTYGFGSWLECDFEAGEAIQVPLPREQVAESVLISSDVIEHLVNPLPMLRGLRQLLNDAPLALLSTPERNVSWGLHHVGPPVNSHHIREWTLAELRRLLEACDFQIVYAGLTRSNDQEQLRHTCLFLLARPGLELNLKEMPEPTTWLEYWAETILVTVKKLLGR